MFGILSLPLQCWYTLELHSFMNLCSSSNSIAGTCNRAVKGYLQRHAHKQRSASWIYTPTSYILWAVSRYQIFFLSCGPSDRDSHVISICFETIFTWSFLNRWCGFLHSLTVHWTGKCANHLHKFKYCSAKKWQHLNLNRLNIKKKAPIMWFALFALFFHWLVMFGNPQIFGYLGKDRSFWLKYITHQIKPLHPEKTTRD